MPPPRTQQPIPGHLQLAKSLNGCHALYAIHPDHPKRFVTCTIVEIATPK
jgi:hypothetical protein